MSGITFPLALIFSVLACMISVGLLAEIQLDGSVVQEV